MNNKKKFFSQMLSLILVASLLLGNMTPVTASASTQDRSTVYLGTSNDDVYGTKRAEWINDGSEAKVTFDITAKKTLENVSQLTKTDIVLVIDISTSMKGNKISNVKAAAKDFVERLLQGTNKNSVKIGLVTYGKGASKIADLSNDDSVLKNKITEISVPQNNGTNIQAGIRKANEILVASKASHGNDAVNQMIILLSDGEPTYSFKATGYDSAKQRLTFPTNNVTTVGSGSTYSLYEFMEFDYRYNVQYTVPGSGSKTIRVTNNGVPTIDEAAAVKDNGTIIYTIGYDISIGSNAEHVMKEVASTGKYTPASTSNAASSIDEILRSISTEVQQVIDTAKGATIVDKIPVWFTIDEARLPQGVTYEATNRTLTWNLGDLKVPEAQDSITKTLSIYLTLDKSKLNANAVWMAGNMVETNETCVLSYLDSKRVQKNVSTTNLTNAIANPALPLATYDYTITYMIEGNGGTITGSTINETGKAFLGSKIPVKSTLASLSLDTTMYQQPEISGQVVEETGNKYLLIGSDNQLNNATVNVMLNRYTVTFFSKESGSLDNSNFVEPQTVIHGTQATKPLTHPVKSQDNENTYEFSNWSISDSQLSNVTSNLNVYPNFKSTTRMYTISFYTDINATDPLATFSVPFGANTVEAPQAPSRPTYVDDTYDYSFAGWDKTWNNITTPEDIRVNGTYSQTKKISKVYFYDVLGNLINTDPQLVSYGTPATAPSQFLQEAPDPDDSNSIRVFNNKWDKPFDNVMTAELHVYAQFDLVKRQYTVKYYDSFDATIPIYTETVDYKMESSFKGTTTPVKIDPNNRYSYTFNGNWSLQDSTSAIELLKQVVSDMEVYAGFDSTENKFNFTFYYWDSEGNNTSIEFSDIPWGGSVTPPVVETVSGAGFTKSFVGWDGDSYQNITKNGSATATDQMTYEVTFIYGSDKSDSQFVISGGNAIPPTSLDYEDDINTYKFTGWDKDYTNIQEPTTITAIYEIIPKEYTITFVNDVTDEVIAQFAGKHYGETVEVPTPENFTKDQYNYTFSHWSEDIGTSVIVTKNATYRAHFSRNLKQYKVDFVNVTMTDNSDTVFPANVPMHSVSVNHGSDATEAQAIATASIDASAMNTDKYAYTFTGWVTSPGGTEAAQLDSITSNTTVYASYSRELLYYTVIFQDDAAHGNAEIARDTIAYGGSTTLPEVTKEEDTIEFIYQTPTWNFESWNKIWENNQFDQNRTIVITLHRPYDIASYEVEFYSEDGSMKFYDDQNKPYLFRYNTKIDSKPGNQEDYQTNTHNYTFVGWGTQPNSQGSLADFDTLTVTGPGIKLYAQYEETERYYTVTFLDENGHEFAEGPYQISVLYGATTLGNATRINAELKAEQYASDHSTPSTKVTFLGWSTSPVGNEQIEATELTNVTKNITVFAMNADTTNLYTVTYMSDEFDATNNGVFATDVVTGGAIVSFEQTNQDNTYVIRETGPTKTSDSRVFSFSHWRVFGKDGDEFFEKENTNFELEENLYLYPVFESSIKKFTVTFVDWDGRVLKTESEVEYGSSATAPTNPSRSDVYSSNTRTVYTFSGWDVEFSNIIADTTVTARYRVDVYYTNPTDPTPVPTTPTPVPPTPTPEVEDIPDPEIPEGTPEVEEIPDEGNEIPEGTPMVDTEDELSNEDTSAEIIDEEIPQATPTLPKTGTAPVGIFYGLGAACAYIGASIIISSRKKKEEECE